MSDSRRKGSGPHPTLEGRKPLGGAGVDANIGAGIDECVEDLCQHGCRYVLDNIAVLERGEHISETARLGEAGRLAVLGELKSVMSVYSNVCNSPYAIGDGI